MFYIYICLYKNLSYLIKTIPPPFLLPQRGRILGLDTISGSSGFLAPLTLGLGPNTMRGNSALLSTMPCRDRPAIEQCLSQFPHAPQILRDEGKLCPPSSPWILSQSQFCTAATWVSTSLAPAKDGLLARVLVTHT